eukprot:767416_1
MCSIILYIAIICNIYLFTSTSAVSACDEIDITFIVDKETILNLPGDVSEFITAIIDRGSAEHAGFSVVLYGDNLEATQNTQLITLEETTPITARNAQEAQVKHKLETSFHNIDLFDIHHRTHPKINIKTKSIKLLDAFQQATKQQ